MRRLPIRLRLTLAFVVVMAAVLAVAGLFIYARVRDELDRGVDADLRARSAAIVALVEQEDSGLPDLRSAGAVALDQNPKEFAEILDANGTVRATLPRGERVAALTGAEFGRAVDGPLLEDRRLPPGGGERFRVYAQPARTQGRSLVIVTGASLADHDAALRRLALLLLVAGPAALALATLAAYALASAALRPVESMRRRAMRISVGNVGQRLPIRPAHDEIARLGDSLNEMLDRLETALRRERAFVADASHELRTPLGLVKSELELALSDGTSTEDLRATIASAADENDRAIALAEDLLVLARIDEKRLPLHLERVAVEDIFASLVDHFDRRAGAAGRELEAGPAEGLIVKLDRVRVSQALGNLVDNALRHGAGPIRLAAERAAGSVELHVLDRGAGFPSDFLPRAFDRFARADPRPAEAGAGLGLAIAKAIANAHGGDAGAANRADGGVDVWISLPALTPTPASSAPPARAPATTRT